MAKKQWVGDYYDAAGKRKRKAFTSKDEATQWEAKGRAAAAQAKANVATKQLQKLTAASSR